MVMARTVKLKAKQLSQPNRVIFRESSSKAGEDLFSSKFRSSRVFDPDGVMVIFLLVPVSPAKSKRSDADGLNEGEFEYEFDSSTLRGSAENWVCDCGWTWTLAGLTGWFSLRDKPVVEKSMIIDYLYTCCTMFVYLHFTLHSISLSQIYRLQVFAHSKL